MNRNAYGNYLKQEITASSQGKLIILMYDACIKFIREGIKAIKDKRIEDAHNNIIKAENIIYELMATLNMEKGGEIAQQLMRIYDFIIWHLVDSNNNKDENKLAETLNIIIPLRDAWKEIEEKESREKFNRQEEQTKIEKTINISG